MSRIATILKQPGEVVRHQVIVPDVDVLTVEEIGATLRNGEAGTLSAVSEGVASGVVVIIISGGRDGEQYLVSVRLSTEDGRVIDRDVEVTVIDAGWVMPDGGAPYLDIAEFVQAYGLPEVVAMTDGVGDGRIDRDMLIKALIAAQSVVDGFIGGRYALPLTTVPQLVKTWVGDIARARLYPNGAPDGVAQAAKDATSMLGKVASGAMPLAVPEPLDAQPASDAPVLHFSGGRTYPDNLRGFR